MRKWPGEVVGAELILGIESLLLEVLGPLLELRPVAAGEVGVAVDLGRSRHQDQHVAALLDRHLVLFGPSRRHRRPGRSHADTGPNRAGANGNVHRSAGGVVHERHDERLRYRRAEQQKLRRHRIEHVARGDAAIGVVFLTRTGSAGRFRRRRTYAAAKHCR